MCMCVCICVCWCTHTHTRTLTPTYLHTYIATHGMWIITAVSEALIFIDEQKIYTVKNPFHQPLTKFEWVET